MALIHSKEKERLSIFAAIALLILFIIIFYFYINVSYHLLLPVVTLSGLAFIIALFSKWHSSIRRQAEMERLEYDGLKQETSMFNNQDDSLVKERNLRQFEKLFVPLFSIILAIGEIIFTLYIFNREYTEGFALKPLQYKVLAATLTISAIILYLGGSFIAGTAYKGGVTILRAVASESIGLAIVSFLTAIVCLLRLTELPPYDVLFIKILAVIILIRGIEKIFTVVMEYSRPRQRNEVERLVYESRINGLFAEPQSILENLSSTLNYQFGIQINEKQVKHFLLVILPFTIFVNVIILLVMSSVIIVKTGEQVVIERFGNPQETALEAGIHFKLPWPIDRSYRQNINEVKELTIGLTELKDKDKIIWENTVSDDLNNPEELLETFFTKSTKTEDGQVFNKVSVGINLQYKISDIYKYLYNYSDPDKLFQLKIQAMLMQYISQNNILDNYDQNDLNRVMKDHIAKQELGLELLSLNLEFIQKPNALVATYREVAKAKLEQRVKLLEAKAESVKIKNEGKLQSHEITSKASIEYNQKVGDAKAKVQSFPAMVKLYRSNQDIFRAFYYYDTLKKFKDVKKVVIAADIPKQTITIDLKEEKNDIFNLNEEKIKDEE